MAITLGGQASIHNPHPLHSSTSIRNKPRSRLPTSVIPCSSSTCRLPLRQTQPPSFRAQDSDEHAALGTRCSANEIQLPAEAAVRPCSERIGADLAGEIDLQRRIDGDHAVVLRYDKRIVGVADRPEFEDGVLMNAVTEPLRSKYEGRHRLAAMQRFPLAIQYSRLD